MASARYPQHYIEQPGASLSPSTIASLADALGLPGKLFAEISHGESGYHPGVVQHDPGDGNVGYGLVQNTPHAWGPAAKQYLAKLGGVNELRDPVKNLLMARFLYKSAGNSVKPWYGTKFVTSHQGEGKLGGANIDKAYEILRAAGGPVGGKPPTVMSDAGGGQSMGSPPVQQGGGIDQALAMLLGQQQRPVIQSAGIQAPSFSARPSLPGGYAPPQGGGGPAPAQNVDALLSLVAGAGQQQAQGVSTAGSMTPAPAGAPQAPHAGLAGGGGQVRIAPGANRPGVGLTPGILKVLRSVAAQAGEPLTVGTGTNHNRMTTSGNVSDHWSGNATDVPASGQKLTKLGQDALIAAGMDPAQARKQTGGLFNLPYGKKRRIQVIFNSNIGGNHFDHLHVGVTAR